MSRLVAGVASIAALTTVMALAVTFAGAHARLDESTPAVGEVVAASPPQVSITFSQDVQKITGTYGIDVFDGEGNEVTTADAVLSDDDRRILTVELPPALPPGRYVVEYKNVSDEDGDPFDGAYAFYVGREPTPEERALDEALTGQEEDATPTAETATTPTIGAEQTRAAAPTTSAPVDDAGDADDSGGGLTLVLVLGAIVLVAVLVTVGFVAFSRRQA